MKTLAEAFEHTLKDIYYAEQQLVKTLPKVAEKASHPQLKQAIQDHLAETEGQVRKLEQVFQSIGVTAKGVRCDAMDGIIKENDHALKDAEQPALDAVIVAGSQAIEHYEITRYGTLVAWAKELGYSDAETILEGILHEEKAADQKLTMIGETQVNDRAQGGQASMQMAAQSSFGGQQR